MTLFFRLCFLLMFCFSGLISCSAAFQHKLSYNTREPIRVAVLPFALRDEQGDFVEPDAKIVVDDIPILFSEAKDAPPALVRKLLYAELSRTALDVVSPTQIDLDLPHRGFAHKDGRFDLKKIFATHPSVFCERFLECDAVIYGTITKWKRSYYGVQSSHEIEIELRMLSARTGEELFYTVGSDTESRGLTKGPTGYSSIIIEPIKGLDADIIEDLARRTIARMVKPLRVRKTTAYSKSPPPAIFAVSHDAEDGRLKAGRPLLVVAFASAGAHASFSVGNEVVGVPMFESSEGHYVGEYWPLQGESFAPQDVVVSVKDDLGRVSSQLVEVGSVSLLAP